MMVSIIDWQWVFYILAILSVVNVALLFFLMPETLDEATPQLKPGFVDVIKQYVAVLKNSKFMRLSQTTLKYSTPDRNTFLVNSGMWLGLFGAIVAATNHYVFCLWVKSP